MVRVRKLVLAIAAASALSSGMAHALGLGEVTLKSALNQPLDAEIELLDVRDLSSSEVVPSLASAEEFGKAGVDRQYFLTDLKFTPVLKPNGKSVVRVTSSKPVREPYLNFLVEVLWPNGRLLREYTLLLDPPAYSPETAAVAPALAATAPAQKARPTASRASASAAQTLSSAPAAASSKVAGGGDYRTTSKDTLWDIAQRNRASGSVHQAMLAIQDLNPDAFVGGNINRLKSGQVLRMPTEQQIASRSQSEAIAQVAAQNAAWRSGGAVADTAGQRQLDATKRSTAGAAPAKVESKDSLRLVSAESGKATVGSDKGAANGNAKALAEKLAVTQESLDTTRRENEELKSRMTDLQSQLDKLQRLIQLKDDQLAKMQGDLSKKPEAAAPAAPAPAPAPAAEQPAPAPQPQAPAEAGAPATPPAGAAPDYNYNQEPAAPDAASQTQNEQPATEPAEAVEKPAAQPAPAPTPAPVPPVEPEQPSFLDELMGNTMLLGIIGGSALLVLLVVLMILSRRNAMKEAELQNSLAGQDGEASADSDLDLQDNAFSGFDVEPAAAPAVATQAAAEERVTAQTGDALSEADIYIAYGRFNQAAELLQNAINDEPQRADLRLKLMEVYAELGDRDGFARQEGELREIGGAQADVDLLKSRYPAMAAVAAAGAGFAAASAADDLDSFSLDDLTLDEPAAPAQKPQDLDDAFDLSLDDELDAAPAARSSAEESLPSLDDLDLDADLSLDLPASSPAAADDDLGFDLELDSKPLADDNLALGDDLADFSLDLDEDAKPSAVTEDDFLLSLDDDLPATAEPTKLETSDFDLPSDFDLSMPEDSAHAEPQTDSFAAKLDEVTAELDQLAESLDQPAEEAPIPAPAPEVAAPAAELEGDDDFDFLSGTDETSTKLDLARAYIDMGDTEGARDILDEVLTEGSETQQQEARDLIARIS
ncbi:FimV family protein [Metapseudomonas otitidis]|uniref:FimV family protein n=1 Tax=Metapseudomonas otitidis TaxID=319939 RepID=UPI0013F60332|nr:FimV family protein [Pseudomonas otitidis]